jgi:hypothetical protein
MIDYLHQFKNRLNMLFQKHEEITVEDILIELIELADILIKNEKLKMDDFK